MTIILKNTSSKSTKKLAKAQTKRQARFDKLWQRIEKQKKQNLKLRTELDALCIVYKEQILPLEIAAKMPVLSLLEKLIDFYSRKSMTKWQRIELTEWINESIEGAYRIDQQKADQLKEQFFTQVAAFHGISKEDMEKTIAEAEAQADSLFENVSSDDTNNAEGSGEKSSNREFTEDMFGDASCGENDEGIPDEDDLFKAFKDAFEEFRAGMETQQAPEPMKFDEKWLKSVFRKTANALHPDKEQDATKREEKERLMAELLSARDDNDVLALITLYYAHVSEDTLEINEQSLDKLCDQLQNQLDRLLYEKRDIISGAENPVHEMVYANLHGKTKKQQEKTIKDYIRDLQGEKETFTEMIQSLKNLKTLKSHLEVRYDEKRFSSFF